MKIAEQQKVSTELNQLIQVFKASEAIIRPHFILTGPSGTGKSRIIQDLAGMNELGFIEINAATLTKEGISGNSLSKALSPLALTAANPTICFVDEFDKLFISGNQNCDLAHESTNGVQNEFLRVLEASTASVFGDYGKYVNIKMDHVLFVFAGAFNGEEEVTLDRLREFGVKTEFLGRVGLVFNTTKVSMESLISILNRSELLENYLKLFPKVKRTSVIQTISDEIKANYEMNTLGIRMVNTLVNQYFIKGEKSFKKEAKKVTFQKTLNMVET
jgi:ATP-dependent protease Clp ATPase subunit